MADYDYKSLMNFKSFDDLRLTAFTRLKNMGSKITNLSVGGVFRTLLELAMQGCADLYSLLLEIVPKGYIKGATGKWLDMKAEDLMLSRKPKQKALGLVIFGRNVASCNALIQAGSIVKTNMTPNGEELRYFTTEDYICPDGVAEIAVPVISEFEGSKYNVGAGSICNVVTHVSGFDYVRNASDWLIQEGADDESDESLRMRCRLRWNEVSQGGTALAYKSMALSVTRVTAAEVDDEFPRGNGTVDIIILGTGGMPTSKLISEVQSVINERHILCSDVLVRGPLAHPITLSMTISLKPTSSMDSNHVRSLTMQCINAYFGQGIVDGIDRLGIGKDFIRLQVGFFLKNRIPDIHNIVFNSPSEDITIDPGEVATIESLTINVERANEE